MFLFLKLQPCLLQEVVVIAELLVEMVIKCPLFLDFVWMATNLWWIMELQDLSIPKCLSIHLELWEKH